MEVTFVSTASPFKIGIISPVSTSVIGWPRAATVPAFSLKKVTVPIPAVESRTHIPAL